MNIEIYPLEKISIDGMEICFGMDQAAVESLLEKADCVGKRHYYFNDELAIDYNNNKVEFIEFLGGHDGKLQPKLYGCNVFKTKADELYDVLKEKNNGVIGDNEGGYSYQFFNISIGVYREAVPESIEEMIEEAAGSGDPMSEEDIEDEMKRADYWATMGVGSVGYFKI